MNRENERITYDEFMTMFKYAPRMCYTLYEKAEDEIEKLKKQKDDVVEYIKSYNLPEDLGHFGEAPISIRELREILKMLGEIDD